MLGATGWVAGEADRLTADAGMLEDVMEGCAGEVVVGGVSTGVGTTGVSSLPASRYEASRFSLERRFWNQTWIT